MEDLAKQLTLTQIWAAVSSALLVVVMMAKHFSAIAEAWPSVQKFFKWAQTKYFREAIFRKDVLSKMESMQLQLNNIAKEVSFNGGSSVKDSVKRIEYEVVGIKEGVEYNKQWRKNSERCSDKMLFTMREQEGCTEISEMFLRHFGWQESDVLYGAYETIVHDEDVLDMRHKWNAAMNKKIPYKDEQRIRDSEGNYHECIVRAWPIIVGGELIEFNGVIELKNV